MKKTLAILSALAMLITALSVNAVATETAEPTITVKETETRDFDGSATIEVDLSNFSNVKGMDLVVNAGSNVKFNSVEGDIVKEGNYKIEDNKLRIVDLTTVDDATIKINATATDDEEIKIKAELAKSGTELFGSDVSIKDNNVIKVYGIVSGTEEETEILTNKTANYFIPYGSVYTKDGDTYEFVPKVDGNPDFTITEPDVYWKKFKIPSSGFGTFGVTKNYSSSSKPTVMFGTYSDQLGKAQHGTMIIAGDWTKLKERYGATNKEKIAELVQKMSLVYDNNISGKDYVNANFTAVDGTKKSVQLYKKNQYNWMWKDNDQILEYAFRLNGTTQGVEYVGVGYYIKGDEVIYSPDIKEITY